MQGTPGIRIHQSTLDTAAEGLRGRGVVQFSNVIADDADAGKHLYVRSGGRLQGLMGRLSGKKSREAYADQICTKLRQVFGNELTAELMRDVRAKIIKTGSLKGDFLAQKLDNLNDLYQASKGQKLRIHLSSPMHVRSDCCIVGYATANAEMQGKLKAAALDGQNWMSATLLDAWGERKGSFSSDMSLSHESKLNGTSVSRLVSLRGMKELALTERQPDEMYKLIHESIGKSTGAIVIEPQPDRMENGVPVYTDAGLRAQLKAAQDCGQEAASARVDRVITFVSPDQKLLARIQALTQTMAGELSSPTAVVS